MSVSYQLKGKRFQRLYTAGKATPTYAASSDASIIASSLCSVQWTEAVQDVVPCLPAHPGKEKTDLENVSNRVYFDAAMFCSDHDSESGTHIARAQVVCYRFCLPRSGMSLEKLNLGISTDPYNSAGARVALYTNSTGVIPEACTACRQGFSPSQNHSCVHSGSTWTTNDTYAEGVAPRTTVDNVWYGGNGTVSFNPATPFTLGKYLFVFVCLESYLGRNGYLEGSACAHPGMTVIVGSREETWDKQIEQGASSVDCTSDVSSGFAISAGGVPSVVNASTCEEIDFRDFYVETPAADTCIPEPPIKSRIFLPAVDSVLTVLADFGKEIITKSSTRWTVTGWTGVAAAGLETDVGLSKNIYGPPQLSYPIGTGDGLIYDLYSYPTFNCQIDWDQVRNPTYPYGEPIDKWDWIRYTSDAACALKDYYVPPLTKVDLPTYEGSPSPLREGDPVLMYSPYGDITKAGSVSFGPGITSVFCMYNSADTSSGFTGAPGVRFLVASKVKSVDDNRMSDFFEFLENIVPVGSALSSIQTTDAYGYLSEGTATKVFVGDPFGVDSNALNVAIPTVSTPDLSNLTIYDAVMCKDLSEYCHLIAYSRSNTGQLVASYWFTSLAPIENLPTVAPYVSNANTELASKPLTSSVVYPVYVTNGTVTKILMYLRLATRKCIDLVSYPPESDLNKEAYSLNQVALHKCIQYRNGVPYYSRTPSVLGPFYYGVKPCFLNEYDATFVQAWAPDSAVAAVDFGPCSDMHYPNRLSPKTLSGSWFSFDPTSGVATVNVDSLKANSKIVTWNNNSQTGAFTLSCGSSTITGTGKVFGMCKSATSSFAYVYGDFTTVYGFPCSRVFRLVFSGSTILASPVIWDSKIVVDDSSDDSSADEFEIVPYSVCGDTLDENVVVYGNFDKIGGVDAPSGAVHVNVNTGTVTPLADEHGIGFKSVTNLVSADLNAAAVSFTRQPGVDLVYDVSVYSGDMTWARTPTAEETVVGFRNCFAKFYEKAASASLVGTTTPSGPIFLVGRASKVINVWEQTGTGIVPVSKSVPTWRILFSPHVVPFSVPKGQMCTKLTVDWSEVVLVDDAGEITYYGDDSSSSVSESSGSASSESTSVDSEDEGRIQRPGKVTRTAKVSRGTLFRVWLNRKARLSVVPDSVATDPSFYDGSAYSVGDWELVGTIDPYSDTSSVFRIEALSGYTGTIALTAWIPESAYDSSKILNGFVGAGTASQSSYRHNIPSVGYGWVPDITIS